MDRRTAGSILLLALLAIAACQPDRDGDVSEEAIDDTDVDIVNVGRQVPNTRDDTFPGGDGPIEEFDITMRNWQFEPAIIVVDEGDWVILRVRSADVDHGIAIPEYGINEEVEPGEVVTIQFPADIRGSFRMYCSVYCGEGHDTMTGTLIVR